MRVLVTGAGGMVGGAILRGLGPNQNVVAPRRADVDLLDAAAVSRFIAHANADVVVHAAGRVGGIEANRRANSGFLLENAVMGFNVVTAARAAGVRRLLNLSSSCVYPRDRELLGEEDILTGPLEPTNQGYAIAKISVMYLCQALTAEDPAVDYKTFIPCNLYGPGDHYEEGVSHLIPSAIRKIDRALAGETRTVAIWGDGSVRREFMYVEDLVCAVKRALEAWDTTPNVLNIGHGHDYSVAEYYLSVAAVMGYTGEFTYEPQRPVGMRRKLLDVRRAQDWGWKAKVSLEDGLAATVRDYLARK